jgi:hypothetical protein
MQRGPVASDIQGGSGTTQPSGRSRCTAPRVTEPTAYTSRSASRTRTTRSSSFPAGNARRSGGCGRGIRLLWTTFSPWQRRRGRARARAFNRFRTERTTGPRGGRFYYGMRTLEPLVPPSGNRCQLRGSCRYAALALRRVSSAGRWFGSMVERPQTSFFLDSSLLGLLLPRMGRARPLPHCFEVSSKTTNTQFNPVPDRFVHPEKTELSRISDPELLLEARLGYGFT